MLISSRRPCITPGRTCALLHFFQMHAVDHHLRAADQILYEKWLGDELFHALGDRAQLFFDVAAAGEKNKRNARGFAAARGFFRRAGARRGRAYGNRKRSGPAGHRRFSKARRRHRPPPARRSAASDPSSPGPGSARCHRPPALLRLSSASFPVLRAPAGPLVGAASPARLLHHINLADRHAALNRLAHVVDGQRGD